ncbi:MAG: hypothetical protein K6L73_00280 [Cellvibrionaceae bacterium]
MDNKDLIWDLGDFGERDRATQFVMQFENKLCVFSGIVGQLYTNYSIHFPQDENHKLVILPNPYAHHDTLFGLPEDAAIDTGLNVIPGEMVGKKGLYITIPFKKGGKVQPVPLQVGIKAINARRAPDNPFLPVLMKGDLRELNQNTPCLHLHAIEVKKLKDMSKMEVSDLQRVITERLPDIR